MAGVATVSPLIADMSNAPAVLVGVQQLGQGSNPLDLYVATTPLEDAEPFDFETDLFKIAETFGPDDFFAFGLAPGFPFCGRLYTTAWISGSGYVQLAPDPFESPPDAPSASAALVVTDARVIIGPWWQPMKGGAIFACNDDSNGRACIEWRAVHDTDTDDDYRARTMQLNLYSDADKPGTIAMIYLGSFAAGAPDNPDDAAVGIRNGDAFRSPHDEADASDATYPRGGHNAPAHAKVRLDMDAWGGEVAANDWYLFEPGDELLRVIVTGTHKLRVFGLLGWSDAQLAVEGWTLTFDGGALETVELGEAPRVCRVTSDGDGWLTIEVDSAFVESVGYTITPPQLDPVDFKGAQRSLARQGAPDGHSLIDIDLPVLPDDDGTPPQARVAGGDLARVGGNAAIIKAIWAALLDAPGERWWKPDHGGQLRLQGQGLGSTKERREEQARLEAVIERMPFVNEAVVTLQQQDTDAWVVTFSVKTRFGALTDRRIVNAV